VDPDSQLGGPGAKNEHLKRFKKKTGAKPRKIWGKQRQENAHGQQAAKNPRYRREYSREFNHLTSAKPQPHRWIHRTTSPRGAWRTFLKENCLMFTFGESRLVRVGGKHLFQFRKRDELKQ
jgi:hypothetical protein